MHKPEIKHIETRNASDRLRQAFALILRGSANRSKDQKDELHALEKSSQAKVEDSSDS